MNSNFQYQKNPNFPNRYISPESLHDFIQANLSDYVTEIGKSTLGFPIYKFSYGSGDINVLAWSQMHGNESNSTHCMLDLWYSLELQPESVGALGARQSRSRSVGHRIIHPPWWFRCGTPRRGCS